MPEPQIESFRVTMMLADSAQAIGGKLYVLGAGWNVATLNAPGAIAGIITIPWNETNKQHHLLLTLVNADGTPVTVPTPNGSQPLAINVQFEVGRPPGVRPGSSTNSPIAIGHAPLPLLAGERYEWRWTIDGESRDDWQLSFDVVAAPQQG